MASSAGHGQARAFEIEDVRDDFDSVSNRYKHWHAGKALILAATALTLGNAGWFIWSNRFLPMSDYPDWMYQGWLFTRLMHGNLPAHFALTSYPVPYATLTTIATGLIGLITTPEAAGKILLTVIVALFVCGSVWMLRAFDDSWSPLLLVPMILALNSFFYTGEVSYALATGLFFVYCGFLFRHDLDHVSGWTLCAWSLVLLFAHLLAWICAILVTAIVALRGITWARVGRLAAVIAPTAALTIWYTAARVASHSLGSGPLFVWWTPHLIAGRFVAAFAPFPAVLPWLGVHTPAAALGAALNVFMCALIACIWVAGAILWLRGRRGHTDVFAASITCLALFVATGFGFARTMSAGERFLYPSAWLAICWLTYEWRSNEYPLLRRGLTLILAAILVAQCAYTDIYVANASRKLAGVYSEMAGATSHAQFCAIYQHYLTETGATPHRKGLDRFLTSPNAVRRLPYYLYIQRSESAPIFQLGIFRYNGPGSNENPCS